MALSLDRINYMWIQEHIAIEVHEALHPAQDVSTTSQQSASWLPQAAGRPTGRPRVSSLHRSVNSTRPRAQI
jgi:hypothetical protein